MAVFEIGDLLLVAGGGVLVLPFLGFQRRQRALELGAQRGVGLSELRRLRAHLVELVLQRLRRLRASVQGPLKHLELARVRGLGRLEARRVVRVHRLDQRGVARLEPVDRLGVCRLDALGLLLRSEDEVVDALVEALDLFGALRRHRLGGVQPKLELRDPVVGERQVLCRGLEVGVCRSQRRVQLLALGLEGLDLLLEDPQALGVVLDLLARDLEVAAVDRGLLLQLAELVGGRRLLELLLPEDPLDLLVEGSILGLLDPQRLSQLARLGVAPLQLGLERRVLPGHLTSLGLDHLPSVLRRQQLGVDPLDPLSQHRDALILGRAPLRHRLLHRDPLADHLVEARGLPGLGGEGGQRWRRARAGVFRALDRQVAGGRLAIAGGLGSVHRLALGTLGDQLVDPEDDLRLVDRLAGIVVGPVLGLGVAGEGVLGDIAAGEQDRRVEEQLVTANSAADREARRP